MHRKPIASKRFSIHPLPPNQLSFPSSQQNFDQYIAPRRPLILASFLYILAVRNVPAALSLFDKTSLLLLYLTCTAAAVVCRKIVGMFIHFQIIFLECMQLVGLCSVLKRRVRPGRLFASLRPERTMMRKKVPHLLPFFSRSQGSEVV